VPSPQDVFGWAPGADYEVADYAQMQTYFRQLAAATDRVTLVEIGRSAMGRPMLLLFISSEGNIRDLEQWRSISERLARARIGEDEARALAAEGKAIVWIDGGMDDMEMEAAQMAPELAHRLATSEEDEIRNIREHARRHGAGTRRTNRYGQALFRYTGQTEEGLRSRCANGSLRSLHSHHADRIHPGNLPGWYVAGTEAHNDDQ